MARALKPPQIIVLGGPNGAGKSTAALGLLKDELEIGEFVNADTIAAGPAAFSPERVAMAASMPKNATPTRSTLSLCTCDLPGWRLVAFVSGFARAATQCPRRWWCDDLLAVYATSLTCISPSPTVSGCMIILNPEDPGS